MTKDLPKIESKTDHTIIVKNEANPDFSPGQLVEGDKKIPSEKWRGYPPTDLRIVGKPLPPLREVSVPRYTGEAQYATRIRLPNTLCLKFLRAPHPRAIIKYLDASKAEKMPGVAMILTYKNWPETKLPPPMSPLKQNVEHWGEIVAIVAADSEDRAEDAVEEIDVEYEKLPYIATVAQALAPDAPKIIPSGNLVIQKPGSFGYDKNSTLKYGVGDVEKGFAESDVVMDLEYSWGNTNILPMQPNSALVKWDGDKVTFWAYGQDIFPPRAALAATLGIPQENLRFIAPYNGGSYGGVAPLGGTGSLSPLNLYAAYISRKTGRPVKYFLTKDEEIIEKRGKTETLSKYRIGAKKDGKIIALKWTLYQAIGDFGADVVMFTIQTPANVYPWDNVTAYCPNIPNWEITGYLYAANTNQSGCNRSCPNQESKWGLEIALDELADKLGMDPVELRLINIAKPGKKIVAKDYGADQRLEVENGTLTFDDYASEEVLKRGARAIGWNRRNSIPGGNQTGRYMRGIGMALSDHHGGFNGYMRGEVGFADRPRPPVSMSYFGVLVEMDQGGTVTIRNGLPDSGTDHDTPMAMLVAEILGYSNLEKIRPVWGDSATTPNSGTWYGGRTTTNAGAAACQAAHELKNTLLKMASDHLQVDASKLVMKDGAIIVKDDPNGQVSFGELVGKAGGLIHALGEVNIRQAGTNTSDRALIRGVGTCFVEVEVDSWTGKVRILNLVYVTDAGLVINPFTSESDQDGAVIQGAGNAFERVPWDLESPGHLIGGVGYLSYGIPTIYETPEKMTHVLINSLEPRQFFGYKSFSETTIGAVPCAIANAVYNATGVRIRNQPISQAAILQGLRNLYY